jgi:hypothetical protein
MEVSMPILKYLCSTCGLKFSKRTSADTQTSTCSCGAIAQVETQGLSLGFTGSVSNSMKAQTTGLESFDLNFDRVVGEDSREKWEVIYQRRRDKWDLMAQHNAQGKDLIRMEDQTYKVIPDMSNALRSNRLTAMDTLKPSSSEEK